MAKYTGSPFGSLSGKIQGVVGSKWKGVDYVRGYVIPHNPNTEDQQAQRGKFAYCVEVGKAVNDLCLKSDWSPVPKKASPYNAFISYNTKALGTAPYALTDLKVHVGSLPNVGFTSAVMSGSGILTLTFTPNLIGEAQNLDDVGLLVYDDEQERWFYGTAKRNAGSIAVNTGVAKSAGDKYTYYYYTVNADRSSGSDSVVTAVTMS